VKVLEKLVTMSRELARPEHGQVILGEGNTSANSGANFWIKGSGNQLASVDESGFVEVDRLKVLQALDESGRSDDDLRQYLNSCRTNSRATVFPSTETYMHAWLLDQPGVDFVGHTHPVNVLGIMCGPHPAKFATERYFPDQIVLCGPKSLLVPYVAPGLALAKAIRSGWKDFVSATGTAPKSILMINHGLICVGTTPSEVVAGCLMMEKAAKVFLAAGDAKPLTPEQVHHIHTWTDEHYRQSKLWKDQS
jgi:rhamnose utilization protein RhaD (predicted bifunctional aldolase and dehydrogenase)